MCAPDIAPRDERARFSGGGIGVVVLRAKTNKLQDLAALVPSILDAPGHIEPAQVLEVPPLTYTIPFLDTARLTLSIRASSAASVTGAEHCGPEQM